MTARRPLLAALLAGLTVAAAACAQTQAGEPGPERASSGNGQSQLAPHVTNPKDGRGIAPCAVLTSAQLTQLGLDPSTQEVTSSVGLSTCGWRDAQTLFDVGVTVDANAGRGLNDTYLKRDGFAVFQPTQIDGYPAVYADETTRPGGCKYYVGIADDQVFFTITTADLHKISDPCELARRASADVLQNLPPLR